MSAASGASGTALARSCRPLPENPDAQLVSLAVSLIHEAGQPYFDWFFGGPEAACAALTESLARPSSETSTSRILLVYADGTSPAGLFIGLDATELQACRKSDLLAVLAAAPSTRARKEVVKRISQTNDLFAPVGAEEYYLSKMAVVPERRGSGVGRVVLDEFIATGAAQGHVRFSLDVAASNAPAVGLYTSAGFREQDARERGGMRYLRMVLERLALITMPVLELLEAVPVP